MLWRVGEGNGEAIYFLGIEDNGSFYRWTEEEKTQSIKTLKKIVNKANLRIVKIDKIKYPGNEYLKIKIREKEKLLVEKRILLLGESGIGKSTFLANLLLSRIDEKNKEARIYLMNHKHELIQKKTSSFNYLYYIYKGIKWVFIEGPGDEKYLKTRNKIILSFGSSIDCCLFFEKNNWSRKDYYVNYLNKLNIPYININLYETNEIKFPNYNGKILIDKEDFFKNTIEICNKKPINKTNKLEFVVLQSFPSLFILTGILKSGELSINNKYYLHSNYQIYEIIIKSIHLDCKPFNKINAPRTISISIEPNDLIKDYIGVITGIPLMKIDKYFIESSKNTNKIIYKDNKIMNETNYKKYYQTYDNIFLVNEGLGFNI